MQSEELTGRLAGTTRRSFIRGIAAAGAAAYTLDRAGMLNGAAHAHGRSRFADFDAIAASAADRFEVPSGFRADVLISWGDRYRDTQGNEFEFGFNNDFLAYFPLKGSREGILFMNHEYPGPFYQHGFKPDAAGVAAGKTQEQVEIERKSVGNAILHVKRAHDGIWRVVSPSKYNTRVYGGQVDAPEVERSRFAVTGPVASDPRVGSVIWGSVGNCSGGITPWGTAISCEENFDGYGMPLTIGVDFNNGWYDEGGHEEYLPGPPYRANPPGVSPGHAKYGWVCEHDPYDPGATPRKHTALGRFRHENTAYRQVRRGRFVIYMGDDRNNDGVYKFVSDRSYHPRDRSGNKKILESGTLYIARFAPEGRRRFANADGTGLLTQPFGTGEWVEVLESELIDTSTLIKARVGAAEWDTHFATNRPEDLEVDPKTGDVYVALTNNSTVRDVHGSVRRIQETGNDPEASTFTWEDYANGGPTGRSDPGEQGFSCVDNLVFDKRNDLWIVTDISTSALNQNNPARPDRQAVFYHANNALFYVPTDEDPEDRIAYRFANMPVEAEGTGPYFTPDEDTLFVNVQHPGELANVNSTSIFGQPATYTSYWPNGENSPDVKRNPSTPKPSTVVITRPKRFADGMNVIPRPAGYVEPKPPRGHHDRDSDSDSDSD
jgi:secreted PhoX family phosphatase